MDLFDEVDPILPFEFSLLKGASIRENSVHGGFDIELPNGHAFYSESFFDQKVCDRCIEYFQECSRFDWRSTCWADLSERELSQIEFTNIKWKQDHISMFGKSTPLPRLTSWYGDPGQDYTYSGIKSAPNEWNKGLLYLKNQIERCAGSKFNSVLLNWYRDGSDYINWHADDEKELGINPTIASANFGVTRDFILRRKDDKSKKLKIPLKNGSLFIMSGELQSFWEHSIPKRKNVDKSRFNLTFRHISTSNEDLTKR